MDIKVHGQNVRITDTLTEYTERKLGRLDRYLPNISEVRVDINRQHVRRGGQQTSAQITLRHSRGAILRAEERILGDDGDVVKTVITKATDKMFRQIERFKGKRRDRRRVREDKFDRYYATEEELALAEEIPELAAVGVDEEQEEEQDVLRRKDVALTPMNEQEAIAQMELLGHTFFMFLNGETGQINVLYRRETGGYGLLIPGQ